MAGNASDDGSDNFSWNTDDEQEIDGSTFDATRALTGGDVENHHRFCEASTSADPSNTNLFRHFEAMGFSRNLVAKAIEENGEGNAESILETLLTYGVLERFSQRENSTETPPMIEQDDDSDLQIDADSGAGSSDYQENLLEDLSDPDSCSGIEMKPTPLPDKDQRVSFLEDMGYPTEEVAIAIARSRPEASIEELADYICAAQMARAADFTYVDPPANEKKHLYGKHKKRRLDFESSRVKRQGSLSTEDESIRLPKPMIGFGIPTGHCPAVHRKLPEAAIGPPYFYYENVALAPKGVWDTISRFLYEVEPEFVDSKHFCAAARKRGYVHNLPIDKRFPLLPFPPRTIHEALPLTRRWWPSWDERTKLNCLQTSIASAKLTDRIRKALEEWEADPPLHVQKFVLEQCRKWNLVWVGRNKAAPLEPDEVEMLLGFPKNHTRGGGISRTDRFKSLGNSFQVDTVAYHLSVLKGMFPDGLNLLSLFSGIGGAEVALHRLGVRLKVVVSVEISEVNRNIVRSWWEQTNQKGTLIDLPDVQQLTEDRLEELIDAFGGFDLVVGGSPCNNLAGGNRVSRDGLEGKESALFYDYFRILHSVKLIMEMKVKKQ